MACELFGFDQEELIGKPLNDFVRLKPKEQATIMESHLETTGEVVNINGNVVCALFSNKCCSLTGIVLAHKNGGSFFSYFIILSCMFTN